MLSAERQRCSRTARTALLSGLVAFVGLQAALTGVMESWVPHLRAPFYGFKLDCLRQRIRQTPQAKVVVMVGSSRTADGLRGELVEEQLRRRLGQPVILFNFGIAGNTPMNELLDLERLLAQGIHPDLLLVEILPSTLSDRAGNLLELLPSERMGLWDRSVLRRHRMPVDQLTRYTWRCWALPWYAHRQEMVSVLCPDFLPQQYRQDGARACNPSGWYCAYPHLTPEVCAAAKSHALGAYSPVLVRYRLGSPFAPAIGITLKRCQEEKIPAALVLMPEASEFRRLYPPFAWTQLEGFLQSLRAEYKTPVINAQKWVPDDGFLDTHHLLPKGAAIFTRRLARDELGPLLEQLPSKSTNQPRAKGAVARFGEPRGCAWPPPARRDR
jgi:hypothetical protein